MSTNSQDQEIDLGQIGKGITAFFTRVLTSIFAFIFFVKKKIVVLSILFLIGVVAAFMLDAKMYTHEISVIPNFKSNEYLYKKVEELDTKLREKDTAFFKQVGIPDFKKIKKIEIEAYNTIFDLVNDKEQEFNFELIKLMAEDGSIDKIMKDETTSKNFYHHKITITTEGMFPKELIITPVLNYLNTSPYFETQQKISLKNVKDKIIFNNALIAQIDTIIESLASNNSNVTVSISEKNSLPELIQKKDELIYLNLKLSLEESNFDKIIKEESSIINIRDYKPLLINNKIVFPFLLILIYFFIHFLRNGYKKQAARFNK